MRDQFKLFTFKVQISSGFISCKDAKDKKSPPCIQCDMNLLLTATLKKHMRVQMPTVSSLDRLVASRAPPQRHVSSAMTSLINDSL